MNSPLPFLEELQWVIDSPYEPTVTANYDFSGYYCPINLDFQMIFCQNCGNYIVSNTICEYDCFIDICDCIPIYPKSRRDWRNLFIQQIYKQKNLVHQEMLSKSLKKDMQKITQLIISLKTNVQIEWM